MVLRLHADVPLARPPCATYEREPRPPALTLGCLPMSPSSPCSSQADKISAPATACTSLRMHTVPEAADKLSDAELDERHAGQALHPDSLLQQATIQDVLKTQRAATHLCWRSPRHPPPWLAAPAPWAAGPARRRRRGRTAPPRAHSAAAARRLQGGRQRDAPTCLSSPEPPKLCTRSADRDFSNH